MNYSEILNSRFVGPAAIFEFCSDTIKMLSINDKYPMEIGMNISEEEYLAHSPFEMMENNSRSIFIDALQDIISGSEAEKEIETYRHLSSNCCGEENVCIRSRILLLEKDNDRYIFFGAIRNVTSEKKQLAELTENDTVLKKAFDQINIYYWEYVFETKDMRPCFRCMRDMGLPMVVHNYPEPVIEMGIFPRDYADMYRDLLKKLEEGLPSYEVDIPLTVGRVPFHIRYTTEFDNNHKPVKAYGSATFIPSSEVDRRKLDYGTIKRLSEDYAGVYIIDLDIDYLKVLRPSESIAGSPQSDTCFSEAVANVMNRISYDIDEDLRKIGDIEHLRRMLSNSEGRREFNLRTPGTHRWLRFCFQVLDKTSDRITKILLSVIIIDSNHAEKLEAEAKIAEQNIELEKRGRQLEEAVAEANRANSVKSEFLSNMSHDIRTPMNAILGYTELALEAISDPNKVKDYLTKINMSGKHLLELINDILDLSRIESGKMELHEAPENIDNIFNEAHELFNPQMNSKNIKFIYSSDIKNHNVCCDRLRINRILLNLISNAYKFTPTGGSIRLSLQENHSTDKEVTYEIHVKDSGIGMSPEFLKSIWEPFTRENNTIVSNIQGTGLGMAIVKNFVTLMGGDISVTSKPGEGTDFKLILTLKLNVGSDTATGTPAAPVISNVDYSGKHVLIVDDNKVNRDIASMFLKKTGIIITEATDGDEAVEIIRNAKAGDFDLILMDIRMHRLGGHEATKQIHALNAPCSNIPIIAMTADAFAEDVDAAIEAGMCDHIAKPFARAEILQKLAKYL